jgi:hypothetical protein
VKIELFGFFDVADLDYDPGALVQQVNHPVVDLIDLFTQFVNFRVGHDGKTCLKGIFEL